VVTEFYKSTFSDYSYVHDNCGLAAFVPMRISRRVWTLSEMTTMSLTDSRVYCVCGNIYYTTAADPEIYQREGLLQEDVISSVIILQIHLCIEQHLGARLVCAEV
jgi:hypothetical protein